MIRVGGNEPIKDHRLLETKRNARFTPADNVTHTALKVQLATGLAGDDVVLVGNHVDMFRRDERGLVRVLARIGEFLEDGFGVEIDADVDDSGHEWIPFHCSSRSMVSLSCSPLALPGASLPAMPVLPRRMPSSGCPTTWSDLRITCSG
ncbi:hypothetical protein D3C76_1227750 [compost metagenome]